MPGLTLRGLGRALGLNPGHLHRLKMRGILVFGDDGLIDEATARAAIESAKSVAHGYMAEVNVAQRANAHHPGVMLASPLHSSGEKSTSPGVAPIIDPGPPPDPALMAAVSATRRAYDTARSERERASADLARLEYQRRTGELVERHVAERVLFEAGRRARDTWLQFPNRVAPLMATALGMSDQDKLLQVLVEHVHAQLEALGTDAADFQAGE